MQEMLFVIINSEGISQTIRNLYTSIKTHQISDQVDREQIRTEVNAVFAMLGSLP